MCQALLLSLPGIIAIVHKGTKIQGLCQRGAEDGMGDTKPVKLSKKSHDSA